MTTPIRYGTTVGDVNRDSVYKPGDVLEASNGIRFVIADVLVSAVHLDVHYRGSWESGDDDNLIKEEVAEEWNKVGEQVRPYEF